MPRSFSQREREAIRGRLLEKGSLFLRSYGIRKTSVEDLTRAANISKGAFYIFFDSKEELFFQIVEQFQEEFRSTILQQIAQAGEPPRQRFKDLLKAALAAWKGNPLFTHFGREEYDYLLRKLPPERVQRHLREDEEFAAQLIAEGDRHGVVIASDPSLVAGLIRALFMVSLHEEDFGDGTYPQVMELLIDLISAHLVRQEISACDPLQETRR